MDKDWFEHAMFQAVLGGESDFVHGEVELDIMTAEPWDPQHYRVLTQLGDEHQNVFLVFSDS